MGSAIGIGGGQNQVVDDFSSEDKNNGSSFHEDLPATIRAMKERAEAQRKRKQ